MALDQISVSTGINPPVSGITSNAGAVNCVGNVIIFNENATGNVDSYSWNFGLGASPATASGPGPIAVVYSTSGTKTITLTVQNTGGSNVGTSSLNIDEPAIAAFGAAYLGSNTWFLNPSGGVVDSVSWSYGDGMDTTLLSTGSVQHTYTANGIFTITQIVYSPCGSDTATSTIEVTEVGVSEWELNGEISAYPNPSNGNVSIQLFHAPNLPLKVTLFDTRGRSIWSRNTVTSADSRFTVSLEDLSQGAYLLEVDGFGRILLQKMDLAK
jgi:PKD repeat protein